MNDTEATMEIQTTKDNSETGMAVPQEIPSKFRAENDEEQNPLQHLPDGTKEQSERQEQFEMVPIDQIEYMTGPQIIHEYRNFLCCYYYKQIRRIKKKEDVESGKPNKVTRVIEAKEWLLGQEPVSEELYVWALKASSWVFVAWSLLIIGIKLMIGLFELFSASDIWWVEFFNLAFIIPFFGGCYFWQRRIIKKALEKNDLSEAKKQYKVIFLCLPFFCGMLFPIFTLSFMIM